VKASYVEIADRFGYYREIIKILDDLVWLGAQWLDEDEARGGPLQSLGGKISRLDSVRGKGVLYWKDEPRRSMGFRDVSSFAKLWRARATHAANSRP
jgi:hypothetical protein